MFKKMRKRIFDSIFYVVLVFVLLISIVSYCVIATNIFNSQKSRTALNAESGVKGCESYLSTVMGFVEHASLQNDVIDALENGNVGGVSKLLDGLCTYAVKIDGAILYGLNGYVAYSAGVGSPPSITELLAIEDIAAFVRSENNGFVSVRKQAIAHTYNRTFYNINNGIVSCLHKVFGSDGTLLGLLAADVTPETLSAVKLDYNSFGTKCNAFLAADGLLSDDAAFNKYYSETLEGRTSDGKYYVANKQLQGGAYVVMYVSLAEFAKRLVLVAGVLLALDVILVSLGALFAKYVCDSVIKPLDKLLKRMDVEKL